jgi:uncharacterized membrane protein
VRPGIPFYIATSQSIDERGEKLMQIPLNARVEATDGAVGQVDELVKDPESGDLTHLVLLEGHVFGKTQVTLPISAVDRVEEDTVYLKLDKDGIKRLPAVPVKKHRDKDGEAADQIEMVARVWDDPNKASETLEFVKGLHQRKVLKILDAAILVKAGDGTLTVHDTKEMEPKRGRVVGAITGGVIGLVGGPIGVVVGALAGAATGGIAAKHIDMGYSDKFLEELEERLQPGSSALILTAEHHWVRSMKDYLGDTGGFEFQQTISDAVAEDLLA